MNGTALHCWGLDHRVADTARREQVHLDRDAAAALLGSLRAAEGFVSAVPLSTCNRTELYVEFHADTDPRPAVAAALAAAGIAPELLLDPPAVHREETAAVEHLYRLAAGLESLLVGEPQIVGQLKDAYRLAKEHHRLGPLVMRAFQGAFRAGKRVRSRTAIGAGAVSVAFAAVELSRKVFADLSRRAVLLVGAGETGALAARHFLQHGAARLLLANRTRTRAEALAGTLAAETAVPVTVVPWEKLGTALGEADVALCATGSPAAVITPGLLRPARRRRRGPLLLLDIAVPRDVDPDVADLDGVYLFGIDDLDEIVQANLAARRREIPRAEKIVAAEVAEFAAWRRDLELAPTVAEMRAFLEELKEKQVGYVRRKADPQAAALVEESLQHFIRKLVNRSMSGLKRTDSPEERLSHLNALRRLFGSGGEPADRA